MEEIVPGRLLRLRAEMRLPGLAWLEMYAETDDAGRTRYRQRALFHPHGLTGHAYWWSVWAFHSVVFGGMARNIARAAARDPGRPARCGTPPPPEPGGRATPGAPPESATACGARADRPSAPHRPEHAAAPSRVPHHRGTP